jgi:hypothetical protein
MSAYESVLLLVGLVGGVILGWLLRSIIRPLQEVDGGVTISTRQCTAQGVRVTGTVTLTGPNTRLLRLYTYVEPDPSSLPQSDCAPPSGSQEFPPQNGGTFDLTHQLSSPLGSGQRIFVFAGIGTHRYDSALVGPCGSGSGSGSNAFLQSVALSEPAARHYQLTVGATGDTGTSPEVRRALERRDVTLAFDQQGSGSGAALWSEEGVPTGEHVRWRLTVRKVEGKQVATLELTGGSGPALVWVCRQWQFFAVNRFVADPASAAGRHLPSLEVRQS